MAAGGLPMSKTAEFEAVVAEAKAVKRKRRRIVFAIQALGLVTFAIPVSLEVYSKVRAEDAQRLLDVSVNAKDVAYFDEVLTQSARLCALLGAADWKNRYFQYVEPIGSALEAVVDLAPEVAAKFEELTVTSNGHLIAMEEEALRLCVLTEAERKQAQAILFGETYIANKTEFTKGLTYLSASMEESRKNAQDQDDSLQIISVVLVIICTLLEVGASVASGLVDYWADEAEKRAAAAEEERAKEVEKGEVLQKIDSNQQALAKIQELLVRERTASA